jgi:RHS repeat-associated protein
VTTIYVSDDSREVLEYDGSSGQMLRRYTYGRSLDEALNQIAPTGQRSILVPDVQGSTAATVDSATGAVIAAGYKPFGETDDTTGSFRYTGRRIDDETLGLYYYRARMYAPALGRFLQPDPIGHAGGNNLYAYVGNDPLNLVDPQGLAADAAANVASGAWSLTAGAYQNFVVSPLQTALTALAQSPLGDPGLYASLQGLGPPGALAGGIGVLGADALRALVGGGRAGAAVENAAPDFIVSRGGTAFPVPEGAQGPVPVINPAGNQTGVAFTGGSSGANGQVSTMRIMDPTPPIGNSPGYPNGYIRYQNNASPRPQAVDPYTGQTIPNSQGHFPIN